MSSERELDEGIKSIKSAWRREHTARANLEKMLENAESENTRLRDLVRELYEDQCDECDRWKYRDRMRELGVDVDKSADYVAFTLGDMPNKTKN